MKLMGITNCGPKQQSRWKLFHKMPAWDGIIWGYNESWFGHVFAKQEEINNLQDLIINHWLYQCEDQGRNFVRKRFGSHEYMNVNGVTGCDGTQGKGVDLALGVKISDKHHFEGRRWKRIYTGDWDHGQRRRKAELGVMTAARGFQDGGYHQGAKHCWEMKKDRRAGAGDSNTDNTEDPEGENFSRIVGQRSAWG